MPGSQPWLLLTSINQISCNLGPTLPFLFAWLRSCNADRSILKCPCMMLIDTGSELNIMMSEHASIMELPVDPAGAVWTLWGVLGHQIVLEGLFRDVLITIGGVEVAHNFFITKDKLNRKDIILGQPWLFSHSTQIDYIHDVRMVIQVWNEGDWENGASVKIKLPILTAPRNIFLIYSHPPI